ncbi:uncharacterized protein BHQ10_006512 [Talaromyces amestolkiae]|uniref:Uncharacterized protein n=1 Tax=Talaromyces amestolkiae TaxID=1196081 RepID=A0A364L3W1_TALAM|nr:uncharacterized protein BHQ10_006512 [Talaromyces amestolkiae]RAO70500.1 hypothetical protein BHQ10_006512 [Talaromyces amestolkiae]
MYKTFRTAAAPAVRCARQQPRAGARFVNARYQSTTSQTASSGNSPALIGGLAGGAVAFASGYAWYHFSGAKTLVKTSKETQEYIKKAKETVVQNTPEPSEAFRWLRDTVKSYAVLIPGARGYVDTAFDDLEKIRNNHQEDFDKIVKDAYNETRDIFSKEGFNTSSASKAAQALQKYLSQLFDLAGDAASDVLQNHPQLKEKVGGSYDQLKQMGDAYGPKAKEEVDKTWQQISDIIKAGVSVDSADKIRSLIQEKKEKLQSLGDEAWKKGLEESQSYLEKNPKLKQLIEENADALKKGNFKELWGLLKDKVPSGKTEDVEKYIKEKVDQAKNTDFSGLDQWLNKLPGGSDLISQLQTLQNTAQKKGSETEDVLKETLEELRDVLKKRMEQVEKLAQE